ncbi:phage portal protein family protein [Nonomuraea sp. 10N515B]|uniref:phage portal protein family protein n=1 Tax=Nonomuraea sp. 10N515B TaxID=3457422 RepID=UPI003FCC8D32
MASAPTRDIGHLDSNYGQWYGDLLEQIPDLTWPLSARTYSVMRHDPQLTAVLAAYSLPIRRATWAVHPAGCRDEVVAMVADDLGLPILGMDAEPGPARRRGVRWTDHLRVALLSLVYGFVPFERRYAIVGKQARLVNLGERMPHTIGSIQLAADESVASITQNLAATRPIPANRLVWYVHDREAANWTGRSVLRASYGAWLLKHETWRVHATSIRRFGMGVPSMEAPPGATAAQVAEAQRLASALRVGDQSGVGIPHGYKLNLTGLTGSVPDALGFIHYLDQQMSRSALAGLMDLGDTSNGSRALGDSFLDLFLLSLQSVADELADTATTGQTGMPGIVTDLVDLNWGPDEPAPRIVVQDVGSRQEVTAEALDMLLKSGAIAPDPALEAYVREAWRLPERSQPAPTPRPDPAPERGDQALAASRRGPRALRAATPANGGRTLTGDEAASGMDPQALQQAWQDALDTVLEAWPSIAEDWREQLATQIEAAVDDGDLQALTGLTIDSADAAELLAVAMLELAEVSAEQMMAEAAAQGVPVEEPPVEEDQLSAVAATVAALLAAGLAGAAAAAALRLAVPGAAGAAVAAEVVAILAALSLRAVRDQVGGALSNAQTSGRFAVLHEAPPARYLASEVLDRNTCKPCRDLDGARFEDLEAAEKAYGNGAYIKCLGGVRCRGQVIAIWDRR